VGAPLPGYRERAEITASHGRLKKDMQDMASAMQVEFGEADNDAKQEFESAREELKNRDSEDYNVLKIQLEGIIEELERHFEQVCIFLGWGGGRGCRVGVGQVQRGKAASIASQQDATAHCRGCVQVLMQVAA
jgi:hypothetical protein